MSAKRSSSQIVPMSTLRNFSHAAILCAVAFLVGCSSKSTLELYGDRVCKSLEEQIQLMSTAKSPSEFKSIAATLGAKGKAHFALIEEMVDDSHRRKSDFTEKGGQPLKILSDRMDKLLDQYYAEQDRIIAMTAFGKSDLDPVRDLGSLSTVFANPFNVQHNHNYYSNIRERRRKELRDQLSPPPSIDPGN